MTQTRLICKWYAFLTIFILQSCVHVNKMPEPVQNKIASSMKDRQYWLTKSVYAGNFYDDDRYHLMHVQPFDELKYVKTLDGDYVLPPPASEIIPAGTKVTIEKIEWPTKKQIFNRPIYSPKFWPWIYLKVARDRGPVTLLRDHTYIMLMPNTVSDYKSFSRWKNGIFSKADTNDWLMSYDNNIRKGMFQKKPVNDMDYIALLTALGEPNHLKKEVEIRGKNRVMVETATFANYVVTLEDGKVRKILKLK